MKTFNKHIFIVLMAVLFVQTGYTQSGYMDNALNYSQLLKNKTDEGTYKLIGTFKVQGTSYLYGEKNKGDLFSPEAKAYNIYLSFNTYSQEVEFYSTSNPDKPLIKEPSSVDSFIIHSDVSKGFSNPLKFIYGSHLGSSENEYYLEMYKGEKYSIYKRYKSELGYVSTNYIQSELRQFDLTYDYFYSTDQKAGLNKLKTNASSIIKEFKKIKDISPVFNYNDFTKNHDEALIKAFIYLNN